MNSLLIRAVLVGGLAGLLFGFDTAVVAGTTSGLSAAFHLDPTRLGITVSAVLWGTLAGAAFAGQPGDRFGTRNCMRAIALLYLASGIGCFVAGSWYALLSFRVCAGLAIGASSVLAPVYLAEISPSKMRGALVGAFQLNIVVGILIAYLSNYLIGLMEIGDSDWRWKFGATAVPAVILFVLLFSIPQSPRWLALNGRVGEATAVLYKMGMSDAAAAVERMLQSSDPSAKFSLRWSQYKKPIALAIVLASFNQLSGINAILYYLNDIFAAAGFSKVSSDQQAVAIGATNLIFTALALLIIDKVGRKTLLLIGSIGLILSLTGTAWVLLAGRGAEYLLLMLIGFIASFAFSQGAVIWVYISEIFPTEIRSRGQSIGSSTHWLMDAIVATLFPVVASISRGVPFVFFAVMMMVQFVVVWRYFPETKQSVLEDIQQSRA